MASEQDLQKNISQAFVKTLRLTEVGQFYKGPEVLFLLNQKFPQLYKDGVFNLEQLYQAMRSVNDVKVDDLLGLFLIFQDQAPALGVQMQLPADLLLMPVEKKAGLHQKAEDDYRAHLLRNQAANNENADDKGEQKKAPIKGFKPINDKKSSKGFRLVGALVVATLALASVLINLNTHTPAKPDIKPFKFDLTPFHLPGELHRKESTYFLKINQEDWDKLEVFDREKNIKDLTIALGSLGMTTLSVMTFSFHTLAVASPGKVVLLNLKPKS